MGHSPAHVPTIGRPYYDEAPAGAANRAEIQTQKVAAIYEEDL